MQQVDDPPYLTVGTEVSAKYKGAFCEAKVRKVVRNIKCKVAYKQQGLGSGVVSDDQIKGALRVGATVEVRHPERKEYVEATLTKIQDCSQYTVVFDDGDITTLRRSALCLKSGRHFNESETLDQLPLTHPEHFGNPVIGGRRGRRSRHLLPDDSSDEDDEPATHSRSAASDKEENIGKVVCVETSDNKKKNPKENWFPGLVVAPTAQDTVRIRVKDEYLVRSFKDGRYYTVPKKETTEFTRDSVNRSEATAVSAAIEYMDNDVLPPHWDREALFGMAGSCSDSDQELETDSSDDEPTEEKDHFVAQLYKFMDDRGTPLNKVPSIINRDVNLYRLFRAVQKLHGYNRVTSQNQWKQIAIRLGYQPATVSITNLVKQAYKKYLFSFEEFNRKLGCTMVPHPKTSRTKGRSLVRASLVQSPKLPEKEVKLTAKERAAAAAAASAAAAAATSTTNASSGSSSSTAADATAGIDESGNTSESSTAESATALRPTTTTATTSSKRKIGGKVKALVDRFEEKETPRSSSSESKDRKDRDLDKPLSQLIASKNSGEPVSSGGRKDDSSSTAANSNTSTGAAAAGSAKKEKGGAAGSKALAASGGGKAAETLAEKRGRKRKDADSVDSKKDDRDSVGTASSSSSSGSTSGGGSSSANLATVSSPSTKPEKLSSSTGSSGGPGGGSDGNRLVHGSGGGGGGPPGGGSRTASPHSSATTPDFPIEAGDKLKVYYDEQKVTYEAKVIEIAIQEGSPIYLVHYTGWNTRYDEWVRKERIAENLTNSKQTKKGKSLSSASSSGSSLHNNNVSAGKSGSGGPNPPSSGDKTPKLGKRMRGNSSSGGGMTPRSTTPNIGRTKSPASTPSNRRPLTRGGGGGTAASAGQSNSTTAAGRRTSNNTDISSSLSVPTDPDSDSDSDEPMMKKCTTNSSTSSTTSSNSSISISSTSTKVSTTAEAGSSSDAAAISDEFSNQGASKGGGVGGTGGVGVAGGGRDYDLNQIRSELKGFKELKSPGSPASDTTTTTTTTTTTAPGDGIAAGAAAGGASTTSTSNPSSNVAAEGTAPAPAAGRQKGQKHDTRAGGTSALKRGSPGRSAVKEEESTVTEEEEEDEPAKSSESEQTLSEEDSSQSSNKAFSSSPITTMVDSDTAETPLIAAGAASSAMSPKSQHHNTTSSSLDHTQQHQQDDSSSNDVPLVVRGATAAIASSTGTEVKGGPISVKQEPPDDGTKVKSEMDAADASNAKPPMKTYGTAATIIANSEKMAFCSLRDVNTEGGTATVPATATSIKSEQQDSSTEATAKDEKVSMEPPPTNPQGAIKTAKKETECDDKKHTLSPVPAKASLSPASNPQAKPVVMVVSAATVKSESTITATASSTPHSVITTTSAAIVGPGGGPGKFLKVSPSSTSPPKSTATEGSGESVSTMISRSPLSSSTITGGVVSTPTAPLSMAHAAGSSSATLAALRAEKKLLNPANSSLSSTTTSSLFGEKKGSLAGTGSSGLPGTKALAGAPVPEKKHFSSSSSLTPAQNKLLSKEALSIKSFFESSTRMDEKISDIYEFKEAEDEFDEQEQGTTGSTRKLVSDVPPAEVVSSLTLAPAAGSAASAGSGLLLDDKRKKPLQRKTPHSELLTPSDSAGAAATGSSFGSMKRMKKVSPIKPTDPGAAAVGASDALVKPTKGPLRRPEVKEKDDQQHREKLASSIGGASEQATVISSDKSIQQPKATVIPIAAGVVQMSTTASAVTGSGGATVAATSSAATTTTPLRFDSTFDVLRKSPSFNLVSAPASAATGTGAKEESSRGEEVDVKPAHPTPTLPGIFTPVGTITGAGAGGAGSSGALLASSGGLDRSGSTSTLLGSSGLGKGSSPSAAVLLAMAGNDDKQKEEPTLENCKKYFNDMNFEFDAPTVKKPPSIADKVLKALSQQQQQQQQQQQHSAAIKQEKSDHMTLKYMPMHHHSSLHSKPYVVNTGPAGAGGGAQEVAGGASLSNVVSSAATIVPVTGGVTVSHTPIKLESAHSSVVTSTKPPASGTSSTEPHQAVLPVALKKELESSVDGVVKVTPARISQVSVVSSSGAKQTSSLHQPSPSGGAQTQQSSVAHRLLDHMLPTARSSNDLTESIRKLDDPRFLHDDESTDSNDSEHRLIIEDAESQGSGEPVPPPPPGGSIQHPSSAINSGTTTSTATVTTGLPSGTAALIVRYDHPTKHQTTNVIAKRELFDDKPTVVGSGTGAARGTTSASGSSITHEMASAASAAAVAAVAEKEKIVFRQDPTFAVSGASKESAASQSTVRTPSSASAPTGREIEKKLTSGAKHNLLETIIQSELNTVNRGLGSEGFLKLKEQTDHQAELDRLQQQQQQQMVATSCATSSVPLPTSSTSTIVTTGTSNQDPLAIDEKSSQQQQQQQQQQQANNESLSLLLCEETIPGSPAPKDQDRLPPVNTGRKVYAETPLGVSSTFLAPPLQNMQTAATDLKPVPMDLEPPVVTITIAGNTTISSTSQAGAAQAAAAAAAASVPFSGSSSSSSQGQSVRTVAPSAATVSGGGPGKGSNATGGGESAVDTPNSSPRDSVSQDETHDPEASISPLKKRRQRKPSEDPPSHKRHRRAAPSSFGGGGGGGYSSANNGSSSGYGRSQRGGMTTANASDSEDNSDSLAAFHRSASSVALGKSGRSGQYNFLVNLDPSLNNNQRIAILKKKIQELRKTYNAIKAELASIDRRRKKLRRRERENKKQAKLNSANAANN